MKPVRLTAVRIVVVLGRLAAKQSAMRLVGED
jgi:hypothetical protein